MRLITTKRLKDNEAFIWRLADRQLDEFITEGRCEFISAYAQPFGMLVVADLLGVPETDHQRFREGFGLSASPGELGAGGETDGELNPLAWLDDWFAQYIEDRRRQPGTDVLTDLAMATYPDGTTPDVTAVVRTATFLFAAGQETTARLLAAALKVLAEHPELQDELRAHSERISNFIEEALRIESPVKADFRFSRRSTAIAGVDVAAGTPVMPAGSSVPTSSASTAPTPAPTSPSAGASIPVPVALWPAPRAGSASSASSTGCVTSGSRRNTTVPPAPDTSNSNPPGSYVV
jgi:cytochrome P450